MLDAKHRKRILSSYSIEIYAYGTGKNLLCKKEEIKCNNIVKQYKNKYFGVLQKKTQKT